MPVCPCSKRSVGHPCSRCSCVPVSPVCSYRPSRRGVSLCIPKPSCGWLGGVGCVLPRGKHGGCTVEKAAWCSVRVACVSGSSRGRRKFLCACVALEPVCQCACGTVQTQTSAVWWRSVAAVVGLTVGKCCSGWWLILPPARPCVGGGPWTLKFYILLGN